MSEAPSMSMFHETLLRRHPELRGIPGPRPRFPLGNMQDFAHAQPWRTSLDYAERYGPYALFWIGNRPALFVHDPGAIAAILGSERASFIKHEPTVAMRPAATNSSIFVSNGADWAAKRRADFFSQERACEWMSERFAPSLAYLRRKLARMLPLTSEDFERQLFRLVFDFQSFLCFGRKLRDVDFRRYTHIVDVVDLRMKTNLPVYSPQFHLAQRKWLGAITEVVEQNAEQPEGRSLSHLWARRSHLPRAALASELSNVFSGGVFSMTVAVAHALCCLSADGRELERVRARLQALADAGPPSYAELAANEALEGVVRESLRLYAPAPVFLRSVKAETVELGGLRLREGVRIVIGMLPLHRDADHWQHAREFIPSRWTPERVAADPYGSDYFFPFGRGPRTCAGQDLALFMIRSLLYALLSDPARELDVRMPTSYRFYFGCMMPKGMRAKLA